MLMMEEEKYQVRLSFRVGRRQEMRVCVCVFINFPMHLTMNVDHNWTGEERSWPGASLFIKLIIL